MAKDEVTIVSAQVQTRTELERRAHVGYRSLCMEIRPAIDKHLSEQKEL